jgi:hypothetical protein
MFAAAACTLAPLGAGASCTSSNSSGGGGGFYDATVPDAGATFGLEIRVVVSGAGRVTSDNGGIDCPTACFSKVVFDSPPGTPVKLTAESTVGWRFGGYTFNPRAAGTRGQGPDNCQPIMRQTLGAPGGVDPSQPQITLAPGQTQGTPPVGQESACAGWTAVPVAYDLTATFVPGGLDGGDGGDAGDAGAGDGGDAGIDIPLYASTVLGATGNRIFVRNGYLLWQWDYAGQSVITAAYSSGTFRTDIVTSTSTIRVFNVSPYWAIYQNVQGLYYMPISTTATPTALTAAPDGGPAPTCVAVTSDNTYAYCRTAGPGGQLLRWAIGSANNMPTLLATGLPAGADLAVDLNGIYGSDTSLGYVDRILLTGVPDGGIPTPSTVGTGYSTPTAVTVQSNYVFWADYYGGHDAYWTGGSNYTFTGFSSLFNTKFVALDGITYSDVWFATVPTSGYSSIYYSTPFGGTPRQLRSNLNGVGGLAVDSTYFYWTGGDASVYRHPRFTP